MEETKVVAEPIEQLESIADLKNLYIDKPIQTKEYITTFIKKNGQESHTKAIVNYKPIKKVPSEEFIRKLKLYYDSKNYSLKELTVLFGIHYAMLYKLIPEAKPIKVADDPNVIQSIKDDYKSGEYNYNQLKNKYNLSYFKIKKALEDTVIGINI